MGLTEPSLGERRQPKKQEAADGWLHRQCLWFRSPLPHSGSPFAQALSFPLVSKQGTRILAKPKKGLAEGGDRGKNQLLHWRVTSVRETVWEARGTRNASAV